MKKWEKQEIMFLKEHYPVKGVNYCSIKLNRSGSSITSKSSKLGLKLNQEVKKAIQKKNSTKTTPVEFNFNKPVDLYILGLLWADGYVHKEKNRVELCLITEDFKDILNLFNTTQWNVYTRNREGKSPSTTLGNYLLETSEYFRDLGYCNKSQEKPKFLDKVPEELKHYFFRGFFDGDGCFYLSKDGKQKQCYLAGSYDQDWDWVEDVFNTIGVEYSIKNKTQNNGKHKYSIVYISRKSIESFGTYLYKGVEFGLNRKRNKFIKIIE